VIRDEISGHTSHSNIVFDRFQKDMLEMQAKLSKLSVEIVGSAQRADLSHQSLKETLLPSVSSLQASVNTLAFRLSRSVTSFEEEVNTIKNSIDSRVTNLAHEVAVFSCLEDVISRIEYDDVSSQVSLLQVQTTSSARTAIAAVAERLQQLEISVQTMDSDQIVAADLFSKRLVCAEDSVAATSDHLELFNTQNTLIMTNMKAIEAQIESHNTEIGVVVETLERSERATDALSKEVERLSVASNVAATRIESQSKAIGVVEETVVRSERATDALSKEVEQLTAESNSIVASACFALKEAILQHFESKIGAIQVDVQVQAEALQELLDTVSKQQAITNDFISEVRSK
jgi:hypothetical protein